MPCARYRFSRDNRSSIGSVSANQASTDALSALCLWAWPQKSLGRDFDVFTDEPETLEAVIRWRTSDKSTVAALEYLSKQVGVSYRPVVQ